MNAPTNLAEVISLLEAKPTRENPEGQDRSYEREQYNELLEQLLKDAKEIKKSLAELKKLALPAESTVHLDDIRDRAEHVEQIAWCDLPQYEPR